MSAYIEQLDLERRVGARKVVEYCDDDGDGVADAPVVAALIQRASGVADSILLPAFSIAEIVQLMTDPMAKGSVEDIAIAIMGGRRGEFITPDGRTPYDGWEKRGKETLRAVASGAERIAKEEAVGRNATIGGGVQASTPAVHVFASTRTNPGGSGGF